MSYLANYVYTFVKVNLKVNCNVNLFIRIVYISVRGLQMRVLKSKI